MFDLDFIFRRVAVLFACTLMMLTPAPGDATGADVMVYLTAEGVPAHLKGMPVWAVDKEGKLHQAKTDNYGRAFLHNLEPGEYWIDLGAGFPRRLVRVERGRLDLKFEVPKPTRAGSRSYRS